MLTAYFFQKLNQDAENIKYEYEAKIASMTKRIQMMELAMDQPVGFLKINWGFPLINLIFI